MSRTRRSIRRRAAGAAAALALAVAIPLFTASPTQAHARDCVAENAGETDPMVYGIKLVVCEAEDSVHQGEHQVQWTATFAYCVYEYYVNGRSCF